MGAEQSREAWVGQRKKGQAYRKFTGSGVGRKRGNGDTTGLRITLNGGHKNLSTLKEFLNMQSETTPEMSSAIQIVLVSDSLFCGQKAAGTVNIAWPMGDKLGGKHGLVWGV